MLISCQPKTRDFPAALIYSSDAGGSSSTALLLKRADGSPVENPPLQLEKGQSAFRYWHLVAGLGEAILRSTAHEPVTLNYGAASPWYRFNLDQLETAVGMTALNQNVYQQLLSTFLKEEGHFYTLVFTGGILTSSASSEIIVSMIDHDFGGSTPRFLSLLNESSAWKSGENSGFAPDQDSALMIRVNQDIAPNLWFQIRSTELQFKKLDETLQNYSLGSDLTELKYIGPWVLIQGEDESLNLWEVTPEEIPERVDILR